MKARVGDRIVVACPTTGGTVRDGEITDVRSADGSPPYLVRWSDTGSTGLYFPGSDAHVAALHADDTQIGGVQTSAVRPADPGAANATPHVRSWRVDIDLFEAGDDTSAHVVLVAESPQRLDARGDAHRNPKDVAIPEIGDEVAVGRALHRLADRLLEVAADDIAAVRK